VTRVSGRPGPRERESLSQFIDQHDAQSPRMRAQPVDGPLVSRIDELMTGLGHEGGVDTSGILAALDLTHPHQREFCDTIEACDTVLITPQVATEAYDERESWGEDPPRATCLVRGGPPEPVPHASQRRFWRFTATSASLPRRNGR